MKEEDILSGWAKIYPHKVKKLCPNCGDGMDFKEKGCFVCYKCLLYLSYNNSGELINGGDIMEIMHLFS